jgi:hypothetical protein
MCRNIKPLFNFAPPATDEEIRAASLQFVRKVSGFSRPSRANEAAFAAAIEEIARGEATLPPLPPRSPTACAPFPCPPGPPSGCRIPAGAAGTARFL